MWPSRTPSHHHSQHVTLPGNMSWNLSWAYHGADPSQIWRARIRSRPANRNHRRSGSLCTSATSKYSPVSPHLPNSLKPHATPGPVRQPSTSRLVFHHEQTQLPSRVTPPQDRLNPPDLKIIRRLSLPSQILYTLHSSQPGSLLRHLTMRLRATTRRWRRILPGRSMERRIGRLIAV